MNHGGIRHPQTARFYVRDETRPAAQRDRSRSVDVDQSRCVTQDAFSFNIIGVFCDSSRRRVRRARSRKKVTLLLITLRSGTLTRAFFTVLTSAAAATPVYIVAANSPGILKVLW